MKRVVAAALLFLGVGCAHAPQVETSWAARNREVISPKTPTDEVRELQGECNGEIESLKYWSKHAKAGDTIDVKLLPGTYTIEDPITITGAKLIIRGPGADKTRIRLDSDNVRALTVFDSPNFELRGVTVAGYSGGGIGAGGCARVVVNECDFAGSRFGLVLSDSTAVVDSCVFAGCETGIKVNGASVTVRSCAFFDGWYTIEGAAKKLDVFGCAFFSNEKGVLVRCGPGSVFRSCLFGKLENLETGGYPQVTASLLFDDLLEKFGVEENRVIHDVNEFPETLPEGFPPGFVPAAVHYALERVVTRGRADSKDLVDSKLEAEARRYMTLARTASTTKHKDRARAFARVAMDYATALGEEGASLRKEIEPLLRPQ